MKMKKLLAAALAATMLFSTMVTSVVASAETTANAVDVTIAEIAVGAETYTANFDITFDPAVEGPHLLFDVDATGTLTNIVSNTEGINVYGDEGGTNLAEGMFITESSNKEFSALSVTATFALDEAAKDADVITVAVAVTDNADWNENTITIAAGSATYTVEAPHECTAGEPVSNNDGTHDIPCTGCDKLVADNEACNYVDGVCSVCGYAEPVTEPTVDSTLALGRTILARDKMGVRFMTVKSQLKSYDSYYLEVKTQHFVSSETEAYALTNNTDTFQSTDADAEDANYLYFDYTGITAFEMTLPIEATIYCVKDGVVVTKSQTWSFTLANRILTSAMTNSAADAAFVDMVNYGAAVQTYFANQNPGSDLAKHGVLPTEGFDAYQQYATSDEIATAAMAVTINAGSATSGYNAAVGKGLQIAATNQIYFLVAPSSYDVNNMKLVVEYVNSYNEDKTATVALNDLVKAGSYYYYYAEGDKNVALFDTAVPVKAKLYLDDTLIYTRTFSVESFVAESMQSGDSKAIGDALMKFTYSLRAKLGLS